MLTNDWTVGGRGTIVRSHQGEEVWMQAAVPHAQRDRRLGSETPWTTHRLPRRSRRRRWRSARPQRANPYSGSITWPYRVPSTMTNCSPAPLVPSAAFRSQTRARGPSICAAARRPRRIGPSHRLRGGCSVRPTAGHGRRPSAQADRDAVERIAFSDGAEIELHPGRVNRTVRCLVELHGVESDGARAASIASRDGKRPARCKKPQHRLSGVDVMSNAPAVSRWMAQCPSKSKIGASISTASEAARRLT